MDDSEVFAAAQCNEAARHDRERKAGEVARTQADEALERAIQSGAARIEAAIAEQRELGFPTIGLFTVQWLRRGSSIAPLKESKFPGWFACTHNDGYEYDNRSHAVPFDHELNFYQTIVYPQEKLFRRTNFQPPNTVTFREMCGDLYGKGPDIGWMSDVRASVNTIDKFIESCIRAVTNPWP